MSNTPSTTTLPPTSERSASSTDECVAEALAAIDAVLCRGVGTFDGPSLSRLQASARTLVSATEVEVLRRCGLA